MVSPRSTDERGVARGGVAVGEVEYVFQAVGRPDSERRRVRPAVRLPRVRVCAPQIPREPPHAECTVPPHHPGCEAITGGTGGTLTTDKTRWAIANDPIASACDVRSAHRALAGYSGSTPWRLSEPGRTAYGPERPKPRRGTPRWRHRKGRTESRTRGGSTPRRHRLPRWDKPHASAPAALEAVSTGLWACCIGGSFSTIPGCRVSMRAGPRCSAGSGVGQWVRALGPWPRRSRSARRRGRRSRLRPG